jgi:16S rRNA (cytosine967-C5)-methyltransferase
MAALALLRAVLDRRQPLDDALAQSLSRGPLKGCEGRERAFARLLATTVLRRLGQIDAVLDVFLETPLSRAGQPARHILRLGAAQLLFLGTPAHAAVGEAVALATATGPARRYRGLVNAVLRRVAREGAQHLPTDPLINLPDWLRTSWTQAYGEAAARAIAAALMVPPPLDISVKEAAQADAWAAKLGAEILPAGTLRRAFDGPIEALPGFAEGAWWVQDAAAALPARLLGDEATLRGRRVYDLCAAPGGKTAQLAALGAEVVAVDRARARLKMVEETLARLGLSAALVEADVGQWTPTAPADFILLDAPCTATGTARRHPDVLRLKTPADRDALAATQTRLLAHAAGQLAAGGVMVYCVCSLEREEGEARVEELLRTRTDMARAPIRAGEIGGLADAITPAGDMRTLPSHLADRGGMDGFYAARLIKQS